MRPDLKTGVSVADENISEDKTENSTVQNLFLIIKYKNLQMEEVQYGSKNHD